LALPTLLYEFETLAIREQVKSRIISGEIKFMRRKNTHGKITKPMKIFYQNTVLTQLQR
jgi:hypothetical protein